jgi:hypothetical protein
VLQSVHARGAALGAAGSPAQVTLELPALPAASTSPRPPGAVALPPPVAGVPPPMPPTGASPAPAQAPVPIAAEAQEPAAVPGPPGSMAR